MPPFSVDRGLAQIDLEQAWMRAMARTRRAGSIHAATAAVFIAGHVKFAYLVPVADALLWELILWVSSAALLMPALLWFGHVFWREWQAYTRLATLTGHPGTAADSTRRARLHLFIEFCRAGRS